MPILTQRAMLLVKVETTAGTDAAPTPALDAIQVIEPSFVADVKMLDRKFARRDFSQYAAIPGQRTGQFKFQVEVAPMAAPAAVTAPRWARLLDACGMARGQQYGVSRAIAASTGAVRASNVVTFTTTVAHGLVVGNAVNVQNVTNTSFNGFLTVASVPTSTTFTVAQTGTDATSGGGTALKVNGELLTPTTDSLKTVTAYLYLDGWLHKLTGAVGDWSLEADSGGVGMLSFTLLGNYLDPISDAFPTGEVFDTALIAPLFEYANLSLFADTSLVISAFKASGGNDLKVRQDANAKSGMRGARVAGRSPTIGLNPNVELSHTFWTKMTSATLGALSVMFGGAAAGGVQGQTIQFQAPAVQITGTGYGDRDGERTYDLAGALRRGSTAGNDEYSWLFM